MKILLKLAIFGLLSFKNVQCLRKCYDSVLQKPVITALLDVHSGEKCQLVNYHGLQQRAILESTIEQINLELKPIGIELVLQIFDTCSTREGAQIAALKALVASKQTCMKQPLFLGFLGPENPRALHAVQDISTLFKIPHIIPYSSERISKNYNIFNVAKYPIDIHTKEGLTSNYQLGEVDGDDYQTYFTVIELVISKLGLQRILLLMDDNHLSKWKAQKLITSSGNKYCLSQPNIINEGNILHTIENLGEDFSSILVIIESPYLVENVLENLKQVNKTILISLGRAGFITWPENINNVYLIQMLSSLPIEDLNEAYDSLLVKEISDYMDSNCGKNISSDRMICDPRQGFHQDWTINLLQYGLLLYTSNIRTAYYMKCHQENVKGLCQKLKYISRLEWNLLLSKASSQIQSPQSVNRNKIITFNMAINVTFVIFSLEDGLIKVGEYKNDELTWDNNYGEENEETLNLSSTCLQFKIRPTKSTITTNYHNLIIPYYADKSSFENIINFRNLGHIQMIGIVCGIGFGITIILTFVFYNVYRGFNIVTNRTSSFSSRTT